jgi:hypothetical protein
VKETDPIEEAVEAVWTVQRQAAVGPIQTPTGQLFDNQGPTAEKLVKAMRPEVRQALVEIAEPRIRPIRKGFRCYVRDDEEQRIDWCEALGRLIGAWINDDPDTAIPVVLKGLTRLEARPALLDGIEFSIKELPMPEVWIDPILSLATDYMPTDRAGVRPLWVLLEWIGPPAIPALRNLAERIEVHIPDWAPLVMESVARLEKQA